MPSRTARGRLMSCFRFSAQVFAAALVLASAGVIAAGADAPLADATEKMDRAAIRALVQRHVDVNAPQVDGMTALHWAVYQDDVETAKLLLGAGATVKAVTRYGVTALSL